MRYIYLLVLVITLFHERVIAERNAQAVLDLNGNPLRVGVRYWPISDYGEGQLSGLTIYIQSAELSCPVIQNSQVGGGGLLALFHPQNGNPDGLIYEGDNLKISWAHSVCGTGWWTLTYNNAINAEFISSDGNKDAPFWPFRIERSSPSEPGLYTILFCFNNNLPYGQQPLCGQLDSRFLNSTTFTDMPRLGLSPLNQTLGFRGFRFSSAGPTSPSY